MPPRLPKQTDSTDQVLPRPVLKWAGGKTQLLPQIQAAMPTRFNKYIEPFIGGGAVFFHLRPQRSIIGDINPELINLYRSLSQSPTAVYDELAKLPISSDDFYRIRLIKWQELNPFQAAARTLYLNRLCFNGLYRVNKRGEFNVPYGNHRNPTIHTLSALVAAGQALSQAQIQQQDYLSLLKMFAEPGDFVFLDPPYVPISQYSDFKRYHAEQFSDTDHQALAAEVSRLVNLGCFVLLTNSNHPSVHTLYRDFRIQTLKTRRSINSRGDRRQGEDLLIIADGFKSTS
jgi:DNA adenine methylase